MLKATNYGSTAHNDVLAQWADWLLMDTVQYVVQYQFIVNDLPGKNMKTSDI